MLDERKIRAIQMLAENKKNKTDIAEIVGVSRTTLYDWMKDDEFKVELDRTLQQIKDYGERVIKNNLSRVIENIINLAESAESEKIKLDANLYLTDRVLGKTTSKVEVKQEEVQTNSFDIDEALEEVEEEEE